MNVQNIIVNEGNSEMRAAARNALKGNWITAFWVGVIALALMYIPIVVLDWISGPTSFEFYYGGDYSDYGYYGSDVDELAEAMSGTSMSFLYMLIITGPVSLGVALFALSVLRGGEASISFVFSGFENFVKALGLFILIFVFTFLWTLLFIIPGIIAAYRYSMAFYILADNPDIKALDAIRASKEMMRNNKAKLFVLQLTFIGWGALGVLALTIVSTALGIAAAFSMSLFALTLVINIATVLIFATLFMYLEVATVRFYEIASGHTRVGAVNADFTVESDAESAAEAEAFKAEVYQEAQNDASAARPDEAKPEEKPDIVKREGSSDDQQDPESETDK